MGLIRLLIRRTLQITNHPKSIIVDNNKWKANVVAHARRQFLGRVEKATVTDQADNRRIRPRHLDADGCRKTESEQTGAFGPDDSVGLIRRIKILSPIAKLGVINNERTLSWQYISNSPERLNFRTLVAESLELCVSLTPPRRGPFLTRTGVRLPFKLSPQRLGNGPNISDERQRGWIILADPAFVPIDMNQLFG